ncbi:MAG: triose-phosphate isomerase [Desulfococcus multivorans]|jgi:triosephosphate isomerase|nr:triose-phosphate isomerase [Desulfococcus multivorans]
MGERKPFIAGNWKMFKTAREAMETATALVNRVSDVTGVEVMIAPNFTALTAVYDVVRESAVRLGAQNLFWEAEGAFTGETSPNMLRDVGCRYVIIGHSERRQYFGETDQTVNKKIKAAVEHGLAPIFCVGETENDREAKKTFSVLDKQVQNGLKDLRSDDVAMLVIAYEPVWAIGTGKTASREQVQEVHSFLRSLIEKKYGNELANSIRIQYGGSVKPNNIKVLMEMPDVDGALVGGASLDADTFSKIIHFQ